MLKAAESGRKSIPGQRMSKDREKSFADIRSDGCAPLDAIYRPADNLKGKVVQMVGLSGK